MQMHPKETTVYDEVLPDASYCLEEGLNVSYATIGTDTTAPIEYCPLEDFCDRYEVSIALEGEPFDNAKLSNLETKWDEQGSCFQDEAKHTQRNTDNPEGKQVNAKFLCCTQDIVCEPNTCGGTYTGVKDDYGCKIYALEICKAETTCKSIGGKTVCDPQPFINGCTWKTKTEFGDTYFTEFNDCGLEVEQPCGTVSNYRCSEDPTILCPLQYTMKTGKYVEGCGGAKI
jgi:hypothetical protein